MSFSLRHLFLLLGLPQQIDTFFSQFLGSTNLTLHHLQVGKEILVLIHIMGNICPHGLGGFQPVEKVSALLHKVSNSGYHLEENRDIVIKRETRLR